MLSLNGARQISGKRVRMSIFIGRGGSPNRPRVFQNNRRRAIEVNRPHLLYDFESRALAVARSRAVQHRADRVNGLAVASNNAADVALAQLHFEDRHFSARNFREHHVVRKFHELPNDELEKFFHWELKL